MKLTEKSIGKRFIETLCKKLKYKSIIFVKQCEPKGSNLYCNFFKKKNVIIRLIHIKFDFVTSKNIYRFDLCFVNPRKITKETKKTISFNLDALIQHTIDIVREDINEKNIDDRAEFIANKINTFFKEH